MVCVIAIFPKSANTNIGVSSPTEKTNRRRTTLRLKVTPPERIVRRNGKEQGLVENTIAILTPKINGLRVLSVVLILGMILSMPANPKKTSIRPNPNLIFSKSICDKNNAKILKIIINPSAMRNKVLFTLFSFDNLKKSKGYRATIHGVNDAMIPDKYAAKISIMLSHITFTKG